MRRQGISGAMTMRTRLGDSCPVQMRKTESRWCERSFLMYAESVRAFMYLVAVDGVCFRLSVFGCVVSRAGGSLSHISSDSTVAGARRYGSIPRQASSFDSAVHPRAACNDMLVPVARHGQRGEFGVR